MTLGGQIGGGKRGSRGSGLTWSPRGGPGAQPRHETRGGPRCSSRGNRGYTFGDTFRLQLLFRSLLFCCLPGFPPAATSNLAPKQTSLTILVKYFFSKQISFKVLESDAEIILT